MTKLGIPFKHPYAGKTGIVATIGKGGPRIALRTDIDALPILVSMLSIKNERSSAIWPLLHTSQCKPALLDMFASMYGSQKALLHAK